MANLFEVKNMDLVVEETYTFWGAHVNLKTAVLKDLNIERWNSLAERTNTKSFVRMTGRHPADYAEVREWVKGLIEHTEKAPAATGAIQYV